jgi:hypothetical protein
MANGSPRGFDRVRQTLRRLSRSRQQPTFALVIAEILVMSEASLKIRDLVKTYLDSRGRPTFTAVKNISVQPNLSPRADRHTIVREFRAPLAEYHLSEQAIEAYAKTFCYHGEFVLVRTDAERSAQALQILQDSGDNTSEPA